MIGGDAVMINTILGGRYEIIEEIGKGGMAYVYKARCIILNRIVALKVLRDDLEGGEEFLKRFNKEAQAAASLTHPNIVSVFDFGIDHGKHYIVMEYVDGITLKEYIQKKGKLSYTEALDIAYQIADALSAAHEKNIVHRDIKPHNILITDDRNIKVTDFGIAHFGTGNTLSTNDDILGSVHYISPEQARGETVDNRSDLYSLGISLYEMISGSVPFDADTPVAVAMMQIKDLAKPIDLGKDTVLPKGVQQIVLKSIAKETQNRYQNALEFKTDILNIMENPEYQLENTDDFYQVKKETDADDDNKNKPLTVKRKRILSILAASTALLIVIAVSLATSKSFVESVRGAFLANNNLVPPLVGKTLTEAQGICKSAGFEILVQNEVDDTNAKPGAIVSQNPIANEKTKKGTIIKVTVNKSKKSLLANYSGKYYKDVQEILEKEGYSVNLIFEESKKDEDIVLRQSPAAGTKLKKDSVITFYVSAGMSQNDNYATVPTLIGNTYDKSMSLLSENGLTIGTVSGVSKPHGDDVVVSQAIPAGSLVKKSSGVGITLECNHEEENPENDNDANSQSSNA